jgi:hypothetical protein
MFNCKMLEREDGNRIRRLFNVQLGLRAQNFTTITTLGQLYIHVSYYIPETFPGHRQNTFDVLHRFS